MAHAKAKGSEDLNRTYDTLKAIRDVLEEEAADKMPMGEALDKIQTLLQNVGPSFRDLHKKLRDAGSSDNVRVTIYTGTSDDPLYMAVEAGNVTYRVQGRHEKALFHRACAVASTLESVEKCAEAEQKEERDRRKRQMMGG